MPLATTRVFNYLCQVHFTYPARAPRFKATQRHSRYNEPMNTDVLSYDISQLDDVLSEPSQPRFRAKQLKKWLYVDGARSYDDMTNVPKSLRAQLAERAPLILPEIVDRQHSNDGTRKYVFQYADGVRVEAVGIPSLDAKETRNEPKHLTVCFSTQAGCAMACSFCATGTEGLSRNLSSGEMVMQVLMVQQDFGVRVTNVVSMGQGEPFQNYRSCLDALRFMNSKDVLGIGARHITISTCGLIKGIEQLSHEPEQFTLAVSLHAARQTVRDELMPRCSSLTLDHLREALVSYTHLTKRRVSLEYLMIKDVNDTEEDLKALQSFTHGLLCHVNLIPLNAIEGSNYEPSAPAWQQHWVQSLKSSGTECTIRNSRGSDIDGACGQLKNKLAR